MLKARSPSGLTSVRTVCPSSNVVWISRGRACDAAGAGPDTVLVLTRGVAEGRTTALVSVLGMTVLAATVQLPLLEALRSPVPAVFDVVGWAGAAYLVWLGTRFLLHGEAMTPIVDEKPSRSKLRSGMGRASTTSSAI
jgi:threonine/homoserine/homoserine lactone efflux protein